MMQKKKLLFLNKKTAPRRAEQKNFLNLGHRLWHPRCNITELDSKEFFGAFFQKSTASLFN
jgi:hypothetical protein